MGGVHVYKCLSTPYILIVKYQYLPIINIGLDLMRWKENVFSYQRR